MALVLVQLWADAASSPAAEMPLQLGAGLEEENCRVPFCLGKQGGVTERGWELCHQPAAQQVFPLYFPGISSFPQSFHFR